GAPGALGAHRDVRRIEPTVALGVCERQRCIACHERLEPSPFLVVAAEAQDRHAGEDDRWNERLGYQRGPELLEQDRRVDEAAAETSELLWEQDRQPSELAHLLPNVARVSDRILAHYSHARDGRLFANEVLRRVGEQLL